MPRFARLRSRRAVEHGQKNASTCSTRPERARARPAPDPARPAPRQATPVSPARARAYKASQGFSRTPPRALDLTGARDHLRLPCRRRASRAIPSPVRPSRETLRASVKLQSEELSSASPETQDHGHRTSPDRRRTWTDLHGEPFFDSLHG